MVSKLKVRPFHKVNSPLDAPVMRRRPSGVHYGFAFGELFYLECPNPAFTYSDGVDGTPNFICGGMYKLGGYGGCGVMWVTEGGLKLREGQ